MIELTLLLRFHLQHCSHNSTRNFAKLDLTLIAIQCVACLILELITLCLGIGRGF